MRNFLFIFVVIVLAICARFVLPEKAKASASATISATPASGSYKIGDTFDVTIGVSGGGQKFTTFGADVSLTNLNVVSLTLNSSVTQCISGASPTATSQSFNCSVASEVDSINVYTMKLQATTVGTGAVTIINGAVIQTDGYSSTSIFSSATGATYTVTAAAGATTVTPKSGPDLRSGPLAFVGKEPLNTQTKVINIIVLVVLALILGVIVEGKRQLKKNKIQ